MLFLKKSTKAVLCLCALMMVNLANAQKLADLLVIKDAMPGQWVSTPTQIPKGLEGMMKSENFCASKEEFLGFLNGSLQMMGSGKNGDNACPTTVISNTAAEAVMKIKCSEKSGGIKVESTYSIKRTANDSWAFSWSGLNGTGTMSTMQTTMKYLGACR
jgi:hypothetical protein